MDSYHGTTILSVRRKLPDLFLQGIRDKNKALDEAWRAGDENARKAHDLIEMALQDEEVSNGPLVDMGLRRFLRVAVEKWTPAERVEYLALVKQKGGRVAWDWFLDGAMCSGVIKSMAIPPLSLTEGDEKKRLDVLAAEAEIRSATMEAQLKAMPEKQLPKLDQIAPRLSKSISESYKATGDAWFPRATRAVDTVLPELKKIVASYKQ